MAKEIVVSSNNSLNEEKIDSNNNNYEENNYEDNYSNNLIKKLKRIIFEQDKIEENNIQQKLCEEESNNETYKKKINENINEKNKVIEKPVDSNSINKEKLTGVEKDESLSNEIKKNDLIKEIKSQKINVNTGSLNLKKIDHVENSKLADIKPNSKNLIKNVDLNNNNLVDKNEIDENKIDESKEDDNKMIIKEQVNSINHESSNDINKNTKEFPEVELIIRASTIDGQRKGACIFCQEYFMDLYLLAELNFIKLKVSTVDMKKPKDFRAKFDCTPPPILLVKVGEERRAILENDKIERYIMKNIPGGHLLFIKDTTTAKLIENLYSKFKLALSRNETHTKESLLKHLKSIDKHLNERNSKYLTGDHICCFDCELMTRLQHIRVAGAYLIDNFEIPKNLNSLWKYMQTMYLSNAFIESCPADQDIINHYLNSMTNLSNRKNLIKNQIHIELQAPIYSLSLPKN